MRNALAALLIFVIVVALGVVTGVLKDEKGISFFWNNLVVISFFGFLVFGIAYGKTVGSIKCVDDVRNMAVRAVSRMSGYIVLVFVMAQFTGILSYTQITKVLAISGADLLKRWNFTGIGMVLTFMLILACINIFMTSSTAKWSIFAPIVVPIFGELGWSPALAQAAFRISDSATNCMSPISPFLFMMIDIARDTFQIKDTNTSQWLSLLIPACFIIWGVWTVLFVGWIMLGLPLGPGAVIHI